MSFRLNVANGSNMKIYLIEIPNLDLDIDLVCHSSPDLLLATRYVSIYDILIDLLSIPMAVPSDKQAWELIEKRVPVYQFIEMDLDLIDTLLKELVESISNHIARHLGDIALTVIAVSWIEPTLLALRDMNERDI